MHAGYPSRRHGRTYSQWCARRVPGAAAIIELRTMNPYLRDKLIQKLESLSDERGYQVLDYVEFLESKYAERQTPARGAGNPLSAVRRRGGGEAARREGERDRRSPRR